MSKPNLDPDDDSGVHEFVRQSTPPDMSNTPQGDSNPDTAEAKIIDRLLNIDNEIWSRAEFPESSISCEATKEVILKEIRQQLKGLLVDARIDELDKLEANSGSHGYSKWYVSKRQRKLNTIRVSEEIRNELSL